jgi:hypothetical protein
MISEQNVVVVYLKTIQMSFICVFLQNYLVELKKKSNFAESLYSVYFIKLITE